MNTPERLFAVLNMYANVIFLCQLRLHDVLMHTDVVLHESIIYFGRMTSFICGLSCRMVCNLVLRGQHVMSPGVSHPVRVVSFLT